MARGVLAQSEHTDGDRESRSRILGSGLYEDRRCRGGSVHGISGQLFQVFTTEEG